MVESGLADALPNARVRFTRAVGYRQLLEAIQIHGYHLMLDAQRPLPRREIARNWYSSVYLPAVEVLGDEHLDTFCPGATAWDRFLWVNEQRRELSVEHGPQPLADVVRLATREIARKRRGVRRLRLRRH
jgi:hypothetical protein